MQQTDWIGHVRSVALQLDETSPCQWTLSAQGGGGGGGGGGELLLGEYSLQSSQTHCALFNEGRTLGFVTGFAPRPPFFDTIHLTIARGGRR